MVKEADYLEKQLTLFTQCEKPQTESSPNGSSGKTSLEHSVQIGEMILGLCWKKSQKRVFQCLNLVNGQKPEWLEAESVTSHGGCSMPNIGASPSVVRESFLSQILEPSADRKYYLSPKACQGILRRARERGKILPEILEKALIRQAGNYEQLTKDKSPALRADMGDNQAAVVYGISSHDSNAMKSDNPHSGIYEAETTRTLDINCGNHAYRQGGMAVVSMGDERSASFQAGIADPLTATDCKRPPLVAVKGNGSRPSHKGDGYKETDKMYTLNATEVHGIAQRLASGKNTTGTLMANCGTKLFSGNQEAFSGDYFVVNDKMTAASKSYSDIHWMILGQP